MASTSETGHNKNLTNFETLTITCTGFGPDYNPSNPAISITALNTQHTAAKTAIKAVKTTETPFNNLEGQRKTAFKTLKPTATKVLNALKAVAVPATVLDDATTINLKIQGKRAENSPIDETTDEKGKKKSSVSQQSYEMQIDHFEKLIELATIEPKYKPNETPLKVATLTTYKTQLQTINTALKTATIPYQNALQKRDSILYTPETGIVDTAQTVKNYVKSVFGASSPQYKQISKLLFKKITT